MITSRDVDAHLAALQRELIARCGFAEFVRLAWDLVEPGTELQWSWHMDLICEDLERVTRREIRDLVVNIPPGFSKSVLVSVLWPAWQWTIDPGHRFIAASHNDRVVMRDAEKMRTLVKSDWYRARWPHVEIPEGKAQSDAISIYRTTRGGMRLSATVRGKLTGDHCDTFIVDDPLDPQRADAISGIELDEVVAWWTGKAATRFRDHTRKARVLVMQRVHVRDLAGEMIRAGAQVLCLPMRFRATHPHRDARDPRTVDGELLDPKRLPEAELKSLEREMGPTKAAAQLDQDPVPPGGAVFRLDWFKRWIVLPDGGTFTLSVDARFKDMTDRGSYVVIQCWYQCGPNFYLVDQLRGRWSFTETLEQIVVMSVRWPRAYAKLVEAKANGPAIVDTLKAHVSGLELLEVPPGDKEARAQAVQPLVSAGNVFVPASDPVKHGGIAVYADGRAAQSWVDDEFLPEATMFPRAMADDQVDAMTQFLNHAAPHNNAVETWRAALKGMFG